VPGTLAHPRGVPRSGTARRRERLIEPVDRLGVTPDPARPRSVDPACLEGRLLPADERASWVP
jgi:hypothetical protein